MAGHKLLEHLSKNHEVAGSVREFFHPRLAPYKLYNGVDVRNPNSLLEPIREFQPEVVFNAVGVVKQAQPRLADLAEINACFPHKLASICKAKNLRLIHLSTDCVYSGRRGQYKETDTPDADEPYGMSKLLGEPEEPALTIRTSLLGRELRGRVGLLEWFYAQTNGEVRGFRKAVFTGITTLELARVADLVISRNPGLTGMWHVASEPINKYTLLQKINREAQLDIRIEADDQLQCDRSLDGNLFEGRTGYQAPDWDSAIRELVLDGKSYVD